MGFNDYERLYIKPIYFDLSDENLKEACQFFENVFDWHF
jgi:predicted enzyme related to lactoylglutathione lyase